MKLVAADSQESVLSTQTLALPLLVPDALMYTKLKPRLGKSDAGQKKARELWFLARFYSAQEALGMGLINHVVPLPDLEKTTVNW